MGRGIILAVAAAGALAGTPAMARDLMDVACSTPAPAHCADTSPDGEELGGAKRWGVGSS